MKMRIKVDPSVRDHYHTHVRMSVIGTFEPVFTVRNFCPTVRKARFVNISACQKLYKLIVYLVKCRITFIQIKP